MVHIYAALQLAEIQKRRNEKPTSKTTTERLYAKRNKKKKKNTLAMGSIAQFASLLFWLSFSVSFVHVEWGTLDGTAIEFDSLISLLFTHFIYSEKRKIGYSLFMGASFSCLVLVMCLMCDAQSSIRRRMTLFLFFLFLFSWNICIWSVNFWHTGQRLCREMWFFPTNSFVYMSCSFSVWFP